MTENKPITHSICKSEKKIDSSGQTYEEKYLEVKSSNIKDCKKVFDEEWNK